MTFRDDFFDDILSTKLSTKCEWLRANQFLFQLANIFLVFTYFAQPNGLVGLVQLRVALTLAGLCFAIWGGMVICSFDCMLWNSAFAIGNALHLLYLFVKLKPKRFDHDHEVIYKEMFKPVGVKRFQYNELIKIVNVSELKEGEYYALQGSTESDHIGIVVHGSFEVLLEGKSLSHVSQYEFLNSPEWLSMSEDVATTYQVSLVANEPSKVFQWKRQKLIKLFKKDSITKNIFDLLIGKDICKKLFSLHQTFLMQDKKVVSVELKQASLLTYSAANLTSHRLLSPHHLLTELHLTERSDRSHSITFDHHDHDHHSSLHHSKIDHQQQQQCLEQQQHHETQHDVHQQQNQQQQQQQQHQHFPSTIPSIDEDKQSVISIHSTNESSVLIYSSSPPKSTHNDGYSLVKTTTILHSDVPLIVVDDHENESLIGSKSNGKVAEDKEFLFRETDL